MITTEQFRALALELPEAEERETWGEPTFRVRGKIFAMLSAANATASIKATLDEQEIIIGSDPATYSIAPYTGRFGWVQVKLQTADPGMIGALLTSAWEQTAPRSLQDAAPAADTPTRKRAGPRAGSRKKQR